MSEIVYSQVGPYQVFEEIGRGGMAVVYRAQHPEWGEVALKILPAYFAHQPGALKRFMREAQAVGRLQHPNIVRVYETGEAPDPNNNSTQIHYIAMEYCKGDSLQQLIQSLGPLDSERVVALGSAIGAALAYAHSVGLIHRDVKPSNILLREHDEPVLTDFGIAYAADASRLTSFGSIAGTIAYLAPEVAQGGQASERSDIYSLSLVLYEALTCHNPYTDLDSHPVAIMQKVANEPLEPIHKLNARVALPLAQVIERGCAKQADHRPASVLEFVRQLQAAPRTEVANVAAPVALQSTTGLRQIELTPMPRSMSKPNIKRTVKLAPQLKLWSGIGAGIASILLIGYLLFATGEPNSTLAETVPSPQVIASATMQQAPTRPPAKALNVGFATSTLPPDQQIIYHQTATAYSLTEVAINSFNQTAIANQPTQVPAAPVNPGNPPVNNPAPAPVVQPTAIPARPQPTQVPVAPPTAPQPPTAPPPPPPPTAPPIADMDGDGVPDQGDYCPSTPQGPQGRGGCPDTDGDGIVDIDDKCPTEPGVDHKGGCPIPPVVAPPPTNLPINPPPADPPPADPPPADPPPADPPPADPPPADPPPADPPPGMPYPPTE